MNRWTQEYLNLILSSSNLQDRIVLYRTSSTQSYRIHTHTHTHTNSTGTDRVYHANRVILLRDPVPTFHVRRNRLIRARDMVSDLVRSSNTGRRCIVLIRRTNAAARQWSNIEDVAFALRKRYVNDQVRVVDFENHSVSEQIRICRDETSILVGIHGAVSRI